MGKRGPPPKPSALKRLQGTYRRDRAPKREARPPGAVGLSVPGRLAGRGREIWLELAPLLADLGLLTAADLGALEAYCTHRALAEEYEGEATKTPILKTKYGMKVNPAAKAGREERSLADRIGERFGLTPSSRSRINVPDPKEKSDPAEDFLFGEPKLSVVRSGDRR